MAIAKKCDICGRLYEPYKHIRISVRNKEFANGIAFMNIETDQHYNTMEINDCCPYCMELINNFVDSLRPNETKEMPKGEDDNGIC